MMALVGFVGLVVAWFSWRYMKGDANYGLFYVLLAGTLAAVMVLVSADNILLFLAAWATSNVLLVRLMVHKGSWKAAQASGRLAMGNFTFGFLCLAAALALLYFTTGQTSIRELVQTSGTTLNETLALVLIGLAALSQSGIWPFHRWIMSSLNSPTPVSALMHAGLVNGGGFVIVRFSPLYDQTPLLLLALFIIGTATAFLGTFWKLMQHDVKRMLASSTVSQMGFMMAQCGLGLFPAAVAHLCWHGLFKAYLFLASGSAAQEKRLGQAYPPSLISFVLALVCGAVGGYFFALASQKDLSVYDTNLFLVFMAALAGSQAALTMLDKNLLVRFPLAAALTAVLGLAYGGSVHLIEGFLAPLNLMQPQPLHVLHAVAAIVLSSAWVAVLFMRNAPANQPKPAWVDKLYVAGLNASQPAPATITAHRNHYKAL